MKTARTSGLMVLLTNDPAPTNAYSFISLPQTTVELAPKVTHLNIKEKCQRVK